MSFHLAKINKLIAGLEASWLEYLTEVNPATQTVKIILKKSVAEPVVLTGTLKNADTCEFEFSITTQTALEKGVYDFQYVVYQDDKPIDIISSGIIVVDKILSSGDNRSINEKILLAIEETLLSGAGKGAGKITVPKTGVAIEYRSLRELQELRLQYLAIVKEEYLIKSGKKYKRTTGVRI